MSGLWVAAIAWTIILAACGVAIWFDRNKPGATR